ncbi:7909_t:CDS:2 [Entrophospora sp. SA101]|nr:7909_t:CDS:2 [Entrophospora sp. SA101]
MVCAYIQTHTAAPQLQFTASLRSWPSAARSELIAVVAVILVSPPNANIRIYTDRETNSTATTAISSDLAAEG